MRERDARAEPFLSGMFTRGEVVYAGSDAEAAHDREPVAIFTGEMLPLLSCANSGCCGLRNLCWMTEAHLLGIEIWPSGTGVDIADLATLQVAWEYDPRVLVHDLASVDVT